MTLFGLAWSDEPLPGERRAARIRELPGSGLRQISSRQTGFRVALVDAYRYSFPAPLLFSLGLGLSLSAFVNGVAPDYLIVLGGFRSRVAWSEAVLAGLLLVGAGYLLVRGRLGGYLGYCAGLVIAAAWGEWLFKSSTVLWQTVLGWSVLLLVLDVLGGVVWLLLPRLRARAAR